MPVEEEIVYCPAEHGDVLGVGEGDGWTDVVLVAVPLNDTVQDNVAGAVPEAEIDVEVEVEAEGCRAVVKREVV